MFSRRRSVHTSNLKVWGGWVEFQYSVSLGPGGNSIFGNGIEECTAYATLTVEMAIFQVLLNLMLADAGLLCQFDDLRRC